jgi:hypothetical protein
MEELGPATEHDAVLAFLQAEIDSPRWRHHVQQGLQSVGAGRSLIDAPNLHSAEENRERISVLAYRGYRRGQFLFTGFPCETARWRRVRLYRSDFPLLRYGNEQCAPAFVGLSRGTRRVVDAAANVALVQNEATVHVNGVIAALRAGTTYPPLLAVESGVGDLILIEGYTRATAHAVVGPLATVDFFVATAPDITRWYFY